LDALVAEMCAGSSSLTQPRPVTLGSSGSSTSSDEAPASGGFTLDDLDSIMNDIQNQSTRRRLPTTYDVAKTVARKTARKTVTGALDGSDLDSVLESIMGVAVQSVQQDTKELGWGLIDTTRTFDLRAPEFTLIGEVCETTIIVKTSKGEKVRIPMDQMSVSLVGMPIRHTLSDNQDGTYTVTFIPTSLGKVQLNVDGFGKRQFEWVITISSLPDASQCEATVVGQPRVNQKCQIMIVAKDAAGSEFKIGGANFSIGFNGVGKLNEVGLSDNLDGTYSLFMVPDTVGEYAIFISLAEVDIRSSPVLFTAV